MVAATCELLPAANNGRGKAAQLQLCGYINAAFSGIIR
jgi:hypothetical protein